VLSGTRPGFWVALGVALSGISLLFIWPFIGAPWWVGLCVGAALFLYVMSEAAFRTWRDLEVVVAGQNGIRVTMGARSVHMHPIPGADAYRFAFDRGNEEARKLVRDGDSRIPRAVRFESPASKRFLKASDLPAEIKTRDGLRRHKIIVHRFVPGGLVFDERDAPHGRGLVCTIYFADAAEEGSHRP
jgi:hypothetical protein